MDHSKVEGTKITMKTLVIVEDHPVVRDITIEMIQKIEPHENIISYNKFERILEVKTEPNLLIMDLNLPADPEGDLRDPLKEFRKKFKNTKIVVFSGFIERMPLGLFEDAQLNGLISKSLETDRIANGFKQILEGRNFQCEISRKHLEERGESGERSGTIIDMISKREFQIFKMLLDHNSEDDIASKLCLSRKTVSNHKHTIMKKLDIHSHADLINYGRKHGF